MQDEPVKSISETLAEREKTISELREKNELLSKEVDREKSAREKLRDSLKVEKPKPSKPEPEDDEDDFDEWDEDDDEDE